ncbi:MAG: hypothetical protein ACPH5K_10115 [Polaribacter sp.]
MIQKKIHYILIAFLIFSCDSNDENDIGFIDSIASPSDLEFVYSVSADNLGIVKITPYGNGVLNSIIDFGDGVISDTITTGESVTHDYENEAVYDVTMKAIGVNGKVTEFTKPVPVIYAAPINVSVTKFEFKSQYKVRLSSKADYAVGFNYYFGEQEDETPVYGEIEELVEYVYSSPESFEIRVEALSGGAASTTVTESFDLSPESLETFEGDAPDITPYKLGEVSIKSNPFIDDVNPSQTVMEFKKGGPQSFAYFQVPDNTFDFSEKPKIRMKVYSNKIGSKFSFKVRTSGSYNYQAIAYSTTENAWEEIVFDFSNARDFETFTRFFIYFDFGTYSSDELFYIDDIELIY